MLNTLIRRARGLCLANVRDLSGKRVYCTRKSHAVGPNGTPHVSGKLSWSTARHGILKITHED